MIETGGLNVTPLNFRLADSISKAAVNMYCMKLARELDPVSTFNSL